MLMIGAKGSRGEFDPRLRGKNPRGRSWMKSRADHVLNISGMVLSVGRLSNWFSAVWAIHEPHHKVYLNKVCNSFCGPELT
jgi:hypothetical protein